MKLWTINRPLRYTGLSLFVDTWTGEGEREPTRIGVGWSGLPGSARWDAWEGNTPGAKVERAWVIRAKLWSINRLLRWSGVRVWVVPKGEHTPTKLGLSWYGLPGSNGWRKIEPDNPTPIRSALARVWALRPWSWETVRDTGITRYQVHPSGKRRAVVLSELGYQPIDRGWVETGEWTTYTPKSKTPGTACPPPADKAKKEFIDKFVQDVFDLCDAAADEPAPDTIVVDERTAELHAQLKDAHERGDDDAVERVRDEAFRRLGL